MGEFIPSELFPLLGTGHQRECFWPFTVAMPKTKELCLADWPQLCLPYPPPASQSSNWMCSVEVTVPKTPQKQQAHFFTIFLVLGSTAHETSHSNIWMRKAIESFEKWCWNAISKCSGQEGRSLREASFVQCLRDPPERTESGAGCCRRSWVPPAGWDTRYFVRMLYICRLNENGTRWLYNPFQLSVSTNKEWDDQGVKTEVISTTVCHDK